MIRWRHRKGDGSGLQSWHRVQTVPLRCSTVCRREHQEAVAARKTDCCRHNKDLIYVGSNPTGENRCLVVESDQMTPVKCLKEGGRRGICRRVLVTKEAERCAGAHYFGDGSKQDPQQEACLYRQIRQERVMFHSPERFWKTGSRISADFAGWDGPQSFLRQIPGWNLDW